MNKLLILWCCLLSLPVMGQVEDTLLPRTHIKPIEVGDKNFAKQYRYLKPRVVKVYPYAMYAANVLSQLENDLVSIEKRRKRNKHCKISYKNLKNDFKYAMLDLYVSEGKVLMSLIARETKSTVYDIVKKYRGADDAMVFNLMGKMFEQDIKAPYVKSQNLVLEYIIREIESGKIIVKSEPLLVTKVDYKAEEQRIKSNKKRYKKAKREKKKLDRKLGKSERKSKV